MQYLDMALTIVCIQVIVNVSGGWAVLFSMTGWHNPTTQGGQHSLMEYQYGRGDGPQEAGFSSGEISGGGVDQEGQTGSNSPFDGVY